MLAPCLSIAVRLAVIARQDQYGICGLVTVK
jgi:hypothetical protein